MLPPLFLKERLVLPLLQLPPELLSGLQDSLQNIPFPRWLQKIPGHSLLHGILGKAEVVMPA
ncbi:hypothetical protein D3C76_1837180 [compost metagenome]